MWLCSCRSIRKWCRLFCPVWTNSRSEAPRRWCGWRWSSRESRPCPPTISSPANGCSPTLRPPMSFSESYSSTLLNSSPYKYVRNPTLYKYKTTLIHKYKTPTLICKYIYTSNISHKPIKPSQTSSNLFRSTSPQLISSTLNPSSILTLN